MLMTYWVVLMPGRMLIEHLQSVHIVVMIQHFSCKFKLDPLTNLQQISIGVVDVQNNGMIDESFSWNRMELGQGQV